jgi:opacity protein-like surface antigen
MIQKMSTSISLIAAALLLVFSAAAQDKATAMETFLGYTFTRCNSATNVPAFSANGGSAQFVYNFNNWLGGVLDAGAVHNGNIHSIHLDSTVATFLLGPRMAMRKWSRFTPYVQTLFGGTYAASSIGVSPTLLVTPHVIPAGDFLRATASETAFAMTAGGGLDIKFSKHVSFRPIQLEYLLTRLPHYRGGNDNTQNNLRYSAGVNFTFGEEQ